MSVREHRLYILGRWILINEVEIEHYKKEIRAIEEEIANEKAFIRWADFEHVLEEKK